MAMSAMRPNLVPWTICPASQPAIKPTSKMIRSVCPDICPPPQFSLAPSHSTGVLRLTKDPQGRIRGPISKQRKAEVCQLGCDYRDDDESRDEQHGEEDRHRLPRRGGSPPYPPHSNLTTEKPHYRKQAVSLAESRSALTA